MMNDKEIISYFDSISHRVDDLEKHVRDNERGNEKSFISYDDLNKLIAIGLFVVGAVVIFSVTRRVSLVLVVALVCAIGFVMGTINKKQN